MLLLQKLQALLFQPTDSLADPPLASNVPLVQVRCCITVLLGYLLHHLLLHSCMLLVAGMTLCIHAWCVFLRFGQNMRVCVVCSLSTHL